MQLELEKQTEAINNEGITVMIWKFKDENGNLWNTETPIDGTEEDARNIILNAIDSNDN